MDDLCVSATLNLMPNKVILHIDMNSYFAAVEQQANPFLRGKSVGVCAYLSPGGCVIASSMEAKAKGIKTGCRVKDALKLDPKAVLVENEPAKYRSVTESIFSIFKEYTDKVEPYSIDEAFLDLTGFVKDIDSGVEAGRAIQARIKDEVGEWLDSSVGVSWTKFLAKFASDIAPKKSLLSIDNQAKLQETLTGRELTDAWGINTRMEYRLKLLGINDLLDLRNYSAQRLKLNFGRYGYYLWANVNGLEVSAVENGSRPPQSIGHSYCVPKHGKDKEYLRTVMFKLCEKTGRRLRKKQLEARRIFLTLSYATGGGLSRYFKVPEPMFTTEEIYYHANRWLENSELTAPVRMLMVSVGSLRPVSPQMSLFEDNLSIKDLSVAMDKLNDKYGEFTVVRGQMYDTGNLAKDRIGFRKSLEI